MGEKDENLSEKNEKYVDMTSIEGTDILSEVPVEQTPGHPSAGLTSTPEGSIPEQEETEAVREPSRFQLFLRRTLIWFGVVAGAFLAGYLTFYFVLFRPQVAELDTAQQQVESLQADLDSATGQLEALTGAYQHRALLQVLVDVYDARLALAEEDVVAAKAALIGTAAVLDEILGEIQAFDSGLAETLPSRLALIRTNLDRDIETAIADCNQLIDDLREVEQALYP